MWNMLDLYHYCLPVFFIGLIIHDVSFVLANNFVGTEVYLVGAEFLVGEIQVNR